MLYLLTLYSAVIEFCLLPFTIFSVSTALLSFSSPFLFPWWKLSEASPSATVFICTKLCPMLKAFLCFSTLWALSCLVSLLVTLLALTDFQVKCVLRATCVDVFVTSALPFNPSVTICYKLSVPTSAVTERFMFEQELHCPVLYLLLNVFNL